MSETAGPLGHGPLDRDPASGRRARRSFRHASPGIGVNRADESFNSLYLAHSADITRLCRSILHDETDAEDAAQEAFAKAWRALRGGLDQPIYPWLRVVARNHCYDVLRKRGRAHPADAAVIEALGPALDGSDRSVIAGVEGDLAKESLRRTSLAHQEILILREALELSYQEIADREEIPLSSVESRLYRARRALRKEYLALVGPDGVAAGIWLRCRGRWFDTHAFVSQGLTGANATAVSGAASPAGAIGKVVAAGAIAAVATLVPVHLAFQRPAPSPVKPSAAFGPSMVTPSTSHLAATGTLASASHLRTPAVRLSSAAVTAHRHRHIGGAPGGTGPGGSGSAASHAGVPGSGATLVSASGTSAGDASGSGSGAAGTTTSPMPATLVGVSTSATPSAGAGTTSTPVPTTIVQDAPSSDATTTASSAAFIDHLAVASGARGAVSYTEQSGEPLLVSTSGTVSASGHLAAGSYVAAGTDKDASGDSGHWTYTLKVAAVTITQSGPSSDTTSWGAAASYSAQLAVTDGAAVPVTFTQVTSSLPMGLKASTTGTVTASGALLTGAYMVSGTDADSLGATGTWSYTLAVIAYAPTTNAASSSVASSSPSNPASGYSSQSGQPSVPSSSSDWGSQSASDSQSGSPTSESGSASSPSWGQSGTQSAEDQSSQGSDSQSGSQSSDSGSQWESQSGSQPGSQSQWQSGYSSWQS